MHWYSFPSRPFTIFAALLGTLSINIKSFIYCDGRNWTSLFFCSEMFVFLQNAVGFNTKSANYAIANVNNFDCQWARLMSSFGKTCLLHKKQLHKKLEKEFLKSSLGKEKILLPAFLLVSLWAVEAYSQWGLGAPLNWGIHQLWAFQWTSGLTVVKNNLFQQNSMAVY